MMDQKDKCPECKGDGEIFHPDNKYGYAGTCKDTCPTCNGTGEKKLARPDKEGIANKQLYPMLRELGVVTECKLSGYKIQEILLETSDRILALFPDIEEAKKQERERIEKEFIWGQVKVIDLEKDEVEWTMRCISDEDWQVLKKEGGNS